MLRHKDTTVRLVLTVLGCVWSIWALGQGELGIETAHAAATTFTGSVQDTLSTVTAFIILCLNFLTWILFVFLQYILDPVFIFDLDENNSSALLDMLHEIWTLSRDLMNVVFAFALVAAAVYTVVTANKEFISQNAKNFVMAVVLVNFSWFFPRVILDIANVTAAAIYGIPSLLETQCQVPDENDVLQDCLAVTDIRFLPTQAEQAQLRGQGYSCITFVCLKKDTLDPDAIAGHSAILNGLIVNHARLGQLAVMSRPIQGNAIKQQITQILRQVLIIVIHIALFFPLMAMTIAFFLRIPVLWITMAFMPFIFLSWVTSEKINQGLPQQLFDQFIKAAFLPAMVAVPLTIGFILINAGASVTGLGGLENITIPIIDEINNFWQLLWLAISLAVLYSGVFKVLKDQNGILSSGAAAIEGFGQQLGQLAINAPLSAPIIPVGGGQAITARQALNAPGSINSSLRFGSDFRTAFAQAVRPAGGGGTPPANPEIRNTARALTDNNARLDELNRRIAAVGGASDRAAFDRTTRALIDELNRTNPRLNANQANLQEVLRELQRETRNRVVLPPEVITRLGTPPAGPLPPAPTPPAPTPPTP